MNTSHHLATLKNPNSKWPSRLAAAESYFKGTEDRALFAKVINELLHSNEHEGRLIALRYAGTYGDAETDSILQMLVMNSDNGNNPGDIELRGKSLRAFTQLAPRKSAELVSRLLQSRGINYTWDSIVVRSTTALPSESAIELCRSVLNDPDSFYIHRDAAWCLAFFGEYEGKHLLADDLKSRDDFGLNYVEAVVMLSKIRVPEAVTELRSIVIRFWQLEEIHRNRILFVLRNLQGSVVSGPDETLTYLTKLLIGVEWKNGMNG
jgi:hypothetical protein